MTAPASASSSVSFSALGQRASPPTIARLMSVVLETPGLLSLAAGFTDSHTLPANLIAETAATLAQVSSVPEYLQYGTNQGRPGLRRVLAERLHLSEPSHSVEELSRSMMITNGSQQALYLAAQVLCEPGDIVLVDRPSYFVFLEMLAGLGVRAQSIPVDATGLVDRAAFGATLRELRRRGEAERVRAIYFVSYYSNPSARSLEKAEKIALAEVLSEHDLIIPVLEDAAYRELYFETAYTAPSVLSLAAWSRFPRFYLSTLTKPFATGLKVGYGVCTEEQWLKKMLHVKGHHDFGTANFNQALFERVLQTDGFDEQLARIRPAYQIKMKALHEALKAEGLSKLGWQWREPAGGLYLWLQAPARLDTRLEGEFCRACLAEGVVYVPGDLCFGDDPPAGYARLSFGVLSPSDLAEAGRRFSRVARRFC